VCTSPIHNIFWCEEVAEKFCEMGFHILGLRD
jgi:hypothetical protein